LVNAPANAQAGATPALRAHPSTVSELYDAPAQPSIADDLCGLEAERT
jgi:hypothetical protein